MNHLILLTTLLSIALLFPPQAIAADQNCKPLYNGGVTSQQVCGDKISTPGSNTGTPQPKATPTPVKRPTGSLSNGSTSKGGLPVLSPAPTQKTPSTGPELLGLIALVPAGALGYYLRKKA